MSEHSDITALHCSSCQRIFNLKERLPRVVPQCGHTFCSSCLQTALASGFLKCPTDQCKTELEAANIEAYPLNLLAKQYLEADMGLEFCEIHTCRKEIVCVTDKCLVCPNCALFSGHKDHELKHVMEIKQQFQAQKNELELSLKNLDNQHQEIIAIMEERKTSLKKTIEGRFEELFFLLKMKKLGLLHELDNIFKRETDKLETAMGSNSQLREKIISKISNYKEMPKNEELFGLLGADITEFRSLFDSEKMNSQVQEMRRMLDASLVALNEALVSNVTKLTKLELPKAQEVCKEGKEEESETETQEENRSRKDSITITSTKNGSHYLKIESSLGFEMCNDYLEVTASSKGVSNIILDLEEWIKTREVRIKLDRFIPTEEDVGILESIWDMLKNLRCVRVDASFQKELPSEKLIALFSAIFGKLENLKEIDINFNESQVTDESILYLSQEILPKVPSLKSLAINVNATNVTDAAVRSFTKNALPVLKELESFIFYVANTNISEEAFMELFVGLPTVGHYEFGASSTDFSDKCMKAFIENTLSSMKLLKRMKIRLWKTKVTDEGAVCLFNNMPDLRNFTVDLGSNDITNAAVEDFVNTKLPNMKSLKNFKLYLYDTKVTEKTFFKIHQFKQTMSG